MNRPKVHCDPFTMKIVRTPNFFELYDSLHFLFCLQYSLKVNGIPAQLPYMQENIACKVVHIEDHEDE